MFTVITVMFAGIGIGYLLRRLRWTQRLGKPITCTVALLLFLMGSAVGTNRTITSSLPSLGMDALLIAGASTLGSVLLATVVYRIFYYQKEKRG